VRYKRGYYYQKRRLARQRTTFGLHALKSGLTGRVQSRNLDSKGAQSPGPPTQELHFSLGPAAGWPSNNSKPEHSSTAFSGCSRRRGAEANFKN